MPTLRWMRRAAIVLGAATLLSGCDLTTLQSALDPAGPVAQEQFGLFMWTVWLSIGVTLLVGIPHIYAIVRFRQRRRKDGQGEEEMPEQVHGNTLLEIGWTILPVLIVIAIAVPTVRTIFATETRVEPTEDDVVVNVVGYQWWWRFEYPEYGIVTANELVVPTDRRVVLNLSSADVLHSFWVPRLAGKRDLIPNQNNQLWFVAEEPDLYYGQCAELCLGAHAYMRMRVIAEPEEEFQQWVDDFRASQDRQVQAGADDQRIQRGRELFAQKGCAGCHTIDGFRPGSNIGSPDYPNLTNFGQRTSIAAGTLDNTQENLEAWLRDPQAVKPGNYMPTLWSDDDPEADEEIEAVAAYLLSLGTESEGEAQAVTGGTHGDR